MSWWISKRIGDFPMNFLDDFPRNFHHLILTRAAQCVVCWFRSTSLVLAVGHGIYTPRMGRKTRRRRCAYICVCDVVVDDQKCICLNTKKKSIKHNNFNANFSSFPDFVEYCCASSGGKIGNLFLLFFNVHKFSHTQSMRLGKSRSENNKI